MQFNSNSDLPSLPASDPLEFPTVDPYPCARITTRIYHPSRDTITMVPNVLVRTMMPRRTKVAPDDSSISSFLSSSSSDGSDMEAEDNVGAESPDTQDENVRAYWMQRTIREAIYGRVLYGIVLKKKRVREAEWVVTTEQCAIKEMAWQHIRKERDRLAEDPIKEVGSMQYLMRWHERITGESTSTDSFSAMASLNIMMPMDLLSDDRHLYSVMPFCDGGELFDRLDMEEKFSEGEARYWMYQILNGIENLQRAGICHRDLSLENLLVHKSGCLIIDMGMCLRIKLGNNDMSMSFQTLNLGSNNESGESNTYLRDGRKSPRHWITPQGTCGKWIYMSPEVYNNQVDFDGFAVDMWAVGVILFLMLTGFPPWERACVTDDRFKFMTTGYLVPMLTEWKIGISADGMDLLQRMLFLDPSDRLSLDQVRAHPWMQGPLTPPLPY